MYYTIDENKLRQIAKRARLSVEETREICTADWPEGQEHQDWLDTENVVEIADWVLGVKDSWR